MACGSSDEILETPALILSGSYDPELADLREVIDTRVGVRDGCEETHRL